MKKIFILFMCFCFSIPGAFAGSSFLDYFVPQNQPAQYQQQCPHCHQPVPANATFCSSCGRQITARYNNQSSSQFMHCPYCYRKFQISGQNAMSYCQNCRTNNTANALYCSNCGSKIIADNFLVTCPYCHKNSQARLSHSAHPQVFCPSCNNWYQSSYKRCRHCKKNKKIKTVVHQPQTQNAYLGSFTKTDNKKSVQKYNISSLTSQRNFSRLVIDVHITEQYAVIINTVKVRVNGKWVSTGGERLQEGRNVIGLSIPQGASELILSINHGRGSEVNLSLE